MFRLKVKINCFEGVFDEENIFEVISFGTGSIFLQTRTE